MLELKALNLHWLNTSQPETDLCAHGSFYLKVNDEVVLEDKSDDWTVSTAAYNFLKTLRGNHDVTKDSYLIPHCGHTMWVTGEEKELYIGGCDIGINWNVTHSKDKVILEVSKNNVTEIDFDEWRNAVCMFSDEIMDFYEKSLPKIIDDTEDKKGFELFMREWKELRAEAFN